MKKLGKSTKKGFTLVELIVVLVILAVLAAMLVPALVGYIDRARAEKEYQTAATIYGAAQAVITEKYAKDTTLAKGSLTKASTNDPVIALAGVDTNAIDGFTFSYGIDYIIGSQAVEDGKADALTALPSGVTIKGTFPTGNNVYGIVVMKQAVYFLELTNGVPTWEARTRG